MLTLSLTFAPVALASGPAQAVAGAYRDVVALKSSGVKSHDLGAYRYFFVATQEPKLKELFRAAFQLHLNLISRYSRMVIVHEVTPQLWRVDMDEVRWDRGTIEAARFVDPFFHERKKLTEDTTFRIYWPGGVDSRLGKPFEKEIYREVLKAGDKAVLAASWLPPREIIYLRETLYTEVPVLMAEWFLVQSCRQLSLRNKQTGLGYADFLRFKDRDQFFDIVKFRQKDSEDLEKEIRAVQELSGVSPNGRQLVQFGGGPTGPGWVALDTDDASGDGVAINRLERGTFKNQIEEWYFHLSNGLPLMGLFNNLGVRQNNAPADKAGFRDDSTLNESKDGRIHLGSISCMRCHKGQVLRSIDDTVRKTFKAPAALGVDDKKRFLLLQTQYFSDLEGALEEDRVKYIKAFTLATITPTIPHGLSAQKAVEAYARAYHAYADDQVSVSASARELGVPTDYWVKALTWQLKIKRTDDAQKAGLDLRLAPFVADPPLKIQRLTWEDAYSEGQELLARYSLSGERP